MLHKVSMLDQCNQVEVRFVVRGQHQHEQHRVVERRSAYMIIVPPKEFSRIVVDVLEKGLGEYLLLAIRFARLTAAECYTLEYGRGFEQVV